MGLGGGMGTILISKYNTAIITPLYTQDMPKYILPFLVNAWNQFFVFSSTVADFCQNQRQSQNSDFFLVEVCTGLWLPQTMAAQTHPTVQSLSSPKKRSTESHTILLAMQTHTRR